MGGSVQWTVDKFRHHRRSLSAPALSSNRRGPNHAIAKGLGFSRLTVLL